MVRWDAGTIHEALTAIFPAHCAPLILGLQKSKPYQALGGGDEGFVVRAWRPSEDAPGFFAGGVSNLAKQRQKLSHGWVAPGGQPHHPIRQLKARYPSGCGAETGSEHPRDITIEMESPETAMKRSPFADG